jgi:hypothetical protein
LIGFFLPQRQTFIVIRIFVFAQRVKLITGDCIGLTQPLRARTDPLAGPDFTGGVVIVLRQMLVEVAFGIRQILLCDGCEHNARY